MKKHLSNIGVFVLLLCVQVSWAQVTGVVTSLEDGLPLPGTIVNIKGSNTATAADGEGKYQIAANCGQTLIFSVVGYVAQEVNIAEGQCPKFTLNIALATGTELQTVEITGAFGLKQSERSVGYNVQQVKGEEIAAAQRDNWVDALNGRVSGLVVTSTSGGVGASSTTTAGCYTRRKTKNPC